MKIILDPHWRRMDELFSPACLQRLKAHDPVWGKDDPMPAEALAAALPEAEALVAATPQISAEILAQAPKLKMVIEVSGAFPDTIDYAACHKRGVEVLSCAPGFRSAVAEMGLAMTLGACRGLVRENQAFRSGQERWLEDCAATDFTLFGARVGFVGFGQIARELARLLAPFGVEIRVFDPWLPQERVAEYGVQLVDLPALAAWAQALYVTAAPTTENAGLIGAQVLAAMPDKALLVILSRAHLVDFDAVTAAARAGRILVATDVFPSEPLAPDHPIRHVANAILSPHRAAAVPGGRHLIGQMICDDLDAAQAGRPTRNLQQADLQHVGQLAGVGDAKAVESLSKTRR